MRSRIKKPEQQPDMLGGAETNVLDAALGFAGAIPVEAIQPNPNNARRMTPVDVAAARAVMSDAGVPPVGLHEEIGGLVPNPEKNMVIEVYPGAVVERVDDMNWQAKFLRDVDPSRARAREQRSGKRWDAVGFYSSPGHAIRKLLTLEVTRTAGTISLETFVERIEAVADVMNARAFAGERAKALAEAADHISDPKDKAKLVAMARRYMERES